MTPPSSAAPERREVIALRKAPPGAVGPEAGTRHVSGVMSVPVARLQGSCGGPGLTGRGQAVTRSPALATCSMRSAARTVPDVDLMRADIARRRSFNARS